MERRLLEYATEICTGENKPYSVEYGLSAISPYSVTVHIIPNYEPQEDVLVFYSNFIFACGEFGEGVFRWGGHLTSERITAQASLDARMMHVRRLIEETLSVFSKALLSRAPACLCRVRRAVARAPFSP